jgi:hypothetical protein
MCQKYAVTLAVACEARSPFIRFDNLQLVITLIRTASDHLNFFVSMRVRH